MLTDKIIITVFGILGIIFTLWFFLFKKEKEIKASGSVDIIVDGGYSPEVISIPFGKTTKLIFLRKDETQCLEEVVLGDFKIRKNLPLNQMVEIEINPKKKGEFDYSCGMGMYHGKIIVR